MEAKGGTQFNNLGGMEGCTDRSRESGPTGDLTLDQYLQVPMPNHYTTTTITQQYNNDSNGHVSFCPMLPFITYQNAIPPFQDRQTQKMQLK